ncbi:hypothetical protein ACFC09_15395 [Streptomyces sp. NPDC056161]|uniref:hypothetical protein n=1 Tax=Streptomyces sp. NPDC056161 TaxID=3345732 RepID=UPI0035D89A7F
MSVVHLHAVPTPDDVSTSAPAAVEMAPGEGPAVIELLDVVPAPAEPAEAEPDQAVEATDEPEGQAAEEEPGEEDVPRRALSLPDLRPYLTADRGTVRELGSLAVEVKRSTAPRVRRGLAPLLRAVWKALRAGTAVVVLVLRAWFSGEIAPKVPPLWRLILGPLVAVYAVGQAVVLYPWTPALLPLVWLLLAVIAQRRAGGKVKEDRKTKASGKGGKGAAKEAGKASPRTFAARLAAAPARLAAEPSPEAPAEASAEAPDHSFVEAAEELEETPRQEALPAPSREDIVRALHALVGGSSGVLHTALRDRLRYPSTRAAREALDAANIPSRPGVRAAGGNGPGVHRRDIPPLRPLQEEAPGPDVVAGQAANNNANNTGEEPGKGLAVEGNDQEREYPFDVLPDPERGPSAWQIIPRD